MFSAHAAWDPPASKLLRHSQLVTGAWRLGKTTRDNLGGRHLQNSAARAPVHCQASLPVMLSPGSGRPRASAALGAQSLAHRREWGGKRS